MHTDVHAASGLAPGQGPNRRDHAYTELKGRLLSGEFRLGARLVETKLATLLGVSRTPIREALLRLDAEGLVERHQDGGYMPLVPDVAAVRALYEVRAGLELLAMQRPARLGTRHDPAVLGDLVDVWEALALEPPAPDPSFVLLDEEFHVTLASAAGNPAIVDHLRQINERIRVVRMVDFMTDDRIESTIEEHLDIARSVLDGELLTAEQRFSDHLDHSQTVVERRVNVAIARMAVAPAMEGGE
jgi:DNA-binding GntR family transcriptional regulator